MKEGLTRHRSLDAIIGAALKAADPDGAVRRHVIRDGQTLRVGERDYDLRRFDEVVLIAAGKAAVPMAAAVTDLLDDCLTRGVVVTKHGHVETQHRASHVGGRAPGVGLPMQDGRPLTVIEAGHPVPDENSLQAGERVCQELSRCTERTLLIACISGGASALLVAPQPGISLAALRAVNDALLRSGADIREMNAVRARLDRLKGGGLARLAAPATVVALILSDVIGDPLDVIASGLTYDPRAHNTLVASNTQACRAAADQARQLGYAAVVVTTALQGEARVRGEEIAAAARVAPPSSPEGSRACLIYGGETTVTVRGSGKGGRNQELALAAAIELNRGGRMNRPDSLVASVGTDGTDGPTDAAGAVAYPDTLERAQALGLDARDHLDRNDSYTFFARLDDLIRTGPTGTNVADVVIALRE